MIDENQDAGEIFLLCRNQVIVAPMGGIVDINIIAVESAMNICKIRNRKDCLKRVMNAFRAWHKRIKEESGNENRIMES